MLDDFTNFNSNNIMLKPTDKLEEEKQKFLTKFSDNSSPSEIIKQHQLIYSAIDEMFEQKEKSKILDIFNGTHEKTHMKEISKNILDAVDVKTIEANMIKNSPTNKTENLAPIQENKEESFFNFLHEIIL